MQGRDPDAQARNLLSKVVVVSVVMGFSSSMMSR
jgi:hypothetical protein